MSAMPFAEVIGDPIAQSKSPSIHKHWLELLGLEGDYLRTRVEASDSPPSSLIGEPTPTGAGAT
jgi:shikimate dehydrogenase